MKFVSSLSLTFLPHFVAELIIGLLCSRDTMLKLWDADTGREMRSMGGHTGTITSVFLLPKKGMSSCGEWDCLSLSFFARPRAQLSVFVSVQFFAYFLSPCLSVFLIFLSVRPPVCLSVCLSVRPPVCPSVCRFTMLFPTFRILIDVPSSFRTDQYSVLTGSKDCSMKIWSLSDGKLSTDQTFVADNFLSIRRSCTTLEVCCEA